MSTMLEKNEKSEIEFRIYKKQAIRAAKDFYYGDTVINKIKHAQTSAEISNIMKTARLSMT